jgi:hypothetical protein
MKLLGFIVYLVFTGTILLVQRAESLHGILMAAKNIFWLLGPPATFTFRTSHAAWIVYAVESVICLGAFSVAVDSSRFRIAACVGLAFFWLVSGFLPYAMSI